MKRITIAVELVSVPALLFADEPTSGLTSHEAHITMSALSRVARSQRPVICTIHQPSSEVFKMFDRLLLLKRGGQVVFFGKLGENARNLVRYFEGIPGVEPMPAGANPANWMLEVIGAGVGRSDKADTGFDFAEVYALSQLKRELDAELDRLLAHGGGGAAAAAGPEELRSPHAATMGANDVDVELGEEGGFASEMYGVVEQRRLLGFDAVATVGGRNNIDGFGDDGADAANPDRSWERARARAAAGGFGERDALGRNTVVASAGKLFESPFSTTYAEQFNALMTRALQELWRTPSYSLMRWLILLFFSVIIGTTFLRQTITNAAAIQSRVGAFNLTLILAGNFNASTIIPFIVGHRAVFYREKASNMYSPFLFAVAQQLSEDPFVVRFKRGRVAFAPGAFVRGRLTRAAVQFVECVLSTVPFYFLVGLANDASSFFM